MISCRWHWKARDLAALETGLGRIVGVPASPVRSELPPPVDVGGRDAVALGLDGVLFSAAIAAGWQWSFALGLFAGLRTGVFGEDGLSFDTLPQPGPGEAWLAVIDCWVGEEQGEVKVWIVNGSIAKIVSWMSLRQDPPKGGRHGNALISARTGLPYFTRFLPEYIRYPHDGEGVLAPMPERRVTSVYEKRENWFELLGDSLDNTARTIVSGRMVYPRVKMLHRKSWLANHPWRLVSPHNRVVKKRLRANLIQ